ncbi:MAG: ATP-dependent zinc metalloprotease FtsH [Lactobacillaceae bacterium]|jgi:cell division protease FtsH|nr:ATP-dependent zinc metalloprotease FtsH [Lactobacillaceae bacterium]
MNNNKNKKNNKFFKNSLVSAVLILTIFAFIFAVFGQNGNNVKTLSNNQLIKNIKDGKIKSLSIQPGDGVYNVSGEFKKEQEVKSKGTLMLPGYSVKTKKFSGFLLTNDSSVKELKEAAAQKKVKFNPQPAPSQLLSNILGMVLPVVLMFALFYWMLNGAGGRGGNGGGNNPMSFGRSKAKTSDPSVNKIRFVDVAGEEEEKQELVEIVEFLKDPKKFTSLGARIPKGVLLEGPPGTGKTLLAKAVAGEAGVPFYSMSGSDFVEMFVGVGASRVRDLFENAKKTAPSIIFIDEIDAVGRRRGTGTGGGNDEREQTLNQILIEMDGFEGNEDVIVLASTNRSDVLDPALLRSGRFDRKILVGAPDVKGREAILNVHAKNKPLANDVDLSVIAQQTPGFVGADLENLLNEAALMAARNDQKKITAADIDEAEDRVIAGPAKRDKKTTEIERQTVAYHEAGHAIVGLVLSDAQVVRKVTIVPRGRAGGYALMMPKDERYLLTQKDATEELAGLMGGRAAEMLIYNQPSSGASNDFQQATNLARAMVTQYGMSEKVGLVQLEGNASVFIGETNSNPYYSDKTSEIVDQEVRRFTQEAFQKATDIIKKHKKQHEAIAQALLKYETLDEAQIKSLFETGEMPKDDVVVKKETNQPLSYEEAKKALKQTDHRLQKEIQEDNDTNANVATKPAKKSASVKKATVKKATIKKPASRKTNTKKSDDK